MKQNFFQSPIGRLRIIAFLEGVSFLLLTGIAMPLKYMAGMPMAVKIAGMAHGVFFILFICSVKALISLFCFLYIVKGVEWYTIVTDYHMYLCIKRCITSFVEGYFHHKVYRGRDIL